MPHNKKPTASKSSAPPLTKEAKLQRFSELFGGRLAHPDTLFLPDCAFYDRLATNDGLQAAAKELYRWLGVKPRRSIVHYALPGKTDSMSLPALFQDLPYQAGAMLALLVIRDSLTTYLAYEADDAFIEFVSLESGLGILVTNGLYPPHDTWETLAHDLRGQWHTNETIIAHAYHPNNYATELLEYADKRQLSARLWAGYVHDEARHRMGLQVHPAHQEIAPSLESARRRRVRGMLVRILLIALIVGSVTSITLFILGQRPAQPSRQVIEQYEEVVLRKQAYEACLSKVAELSRGSENNDIYADQHLNAEKSRCFSLQNSYNAAVGRYNALLPR